MSAASGHTFSYVNKHGPPLTTATMSRMSIDERYGRSWATHYSDSQQHLLPSSGSVGGGGGGSNTTITTGGGGGGGNNGNYYANGMVSFNLFTFKYDKLNGLL